MKLTVKVGNSPVVFEVALEGDFHSVAAELNDLFSLFLVLREEYGELFTPERPPAAARPGVPTRPAAARPSPVARAAAAAVRRPANQAAEIVEEVTAIVVAPNGRVKFKTPSLSRYGVLLTEATSLEPAVQALIPESGEVAVAGVRVSHDGKVALSVFAE